MPAIGLANPNPRPVHGAYWLDVRDFGARAMGDGFDNAPAFQAAHDAATALVASADGGNQAGAVVFVPAAPLAYGFASTVEVDGSFVAFRGEGEATKLVMIGGVPGPPIRLGLARVARVGGVAYSASSAFRPDLWNGGSPVLDSSAVTAAGQRWGFRTNGTSASPAFLYSQCSHFTHGGQSALYGYPYVDYWQETPKLTVDVAWRAFSDVSDATLMGAGDPNQLAAPNGAHPWLLFTRGTSYYFALSTTVGRFGALTTGTYSFNPGSLAGVQRVSIQVDLTDLASPVSAFVNGTQLAVSGPALAAGSVLNETSWREFNVGGFTFNGSGADFALYGLCLSKSIRYAVGAAGSAQAIAAGGTLNDAYRYFPSLAADPNFIGYLGFAENPQAVPTAAVAQGNLVTQGTFTLSYGGQTTAAIAYDAAPAQVQAAFTALSTVGAGNATVAGRGPLAGHDLTIAFAGAMAGTSAAGIGINGSGLTNGSAWLTYTPIPPRRLLVTGATGWDSEVLLCNAPMFNANNPGSSGVSDLAVLGSMYGMGIATASTLEARFERLNINNCLYGIGTLNAVANYITHVVDCTIAASDAAFYADYNESRLRGVQFVSSGRATVRAAGANLHVQDVNVAFQAPYSACFASLHSGGYGGQSTFRNIGVDFEGSTYGEAVFVAEREAASVTTTLRVSGLNQGTVGAVPIFRLKDYLGPQSPPGLLLADNIIVAGAGSSIVAVDGPGWGGSVEGFQCMATPHVAVVGGSSRPSVRVRERLFKSPPRYGAWLAGPSEFDVPGPVDGQYSRLAIVGDGAFGTATPPAYAGRDLGQADPTASLAGYALAHTAALATLSGQASSWGALTTKYACPQLATTLFGGQPFDQTIASQFGGGPMGGSAWVAVAGSATGGTFTLSYKGQTTAAIAYNATQSAVQSAFTALTTVGAGNATVSGINGGSGPFIVTMAGTLAGAGYAMGVSGSGAGLTGGGLTVVPNVLPPTYYAALSTTPTDRFGACSEPAGGGYARVAVPNSSASFAASSAGSKATAAAIAWPTLTAATTVQAIVLYDAPTGGNPWLTIQLAAPATIAAGTAPTIAAGGLTFAHAPHRGATGTATDFAWGKSVDLMFGATPTAVPATWYVGLSTVAANRAGTVAEPTTGGYARAALANTAANWTPQPYPPTATYQGGDVVNAAPIAFPTPTAAWGTALSLPVFDAATGGNCWFEAACPPITPGTASAPTLAPGALLLAPAG